MSEYLHGPPDVSLLYQLYTLLNIWVRFFVPDEVILQFLVAWRVAFA